MNKTAICDIITICRNGKEQERTGMKQKRIIYYGLPALAALICLWYIREASCNVVYTDYIRLVNSYLPDVWNPAKFFVPDVLTRIPIHYLGRIINVAFFDYNTMFDMALGVLGLGLSGFVLAGYCSRQKLGIGWYLFFTLILFNLNKWEMLTNGTGWGHFLAFAGFYYHYVVFDRVLGGKERPHDRAKLLALPAVITLGLAGPYCAVYTATLILFYCGAAWSRMYRVKKSSDRRTDLTEMHRAVEQARFWVFGCISAMVPFLLYLWSNSYAVEDHAGAVDITLLEALSGAAGFFPRFLLKSFASMTFGGETFEGWIRSGQIADRTIYLIGALVLAGYLLALYLNWRFRLYRRTILPLMLLVGGLGNHGIVLISRFIFLNENYGMSSRYALQYQMGILGIVLTVGLLWSQLKPAVCRLAACVVCVALLAGQAHTNLIEWKKAPDRERYAERIAATALQFEEVSDEVLRETFDYRRSRPDSGAKVRQALTILKDNGWNVFSR